MRASLSSPHTCSYLPPPSPSIQNLLIITLIFALNNMPPALFSLFFPPHLCAFVHPFVLASFRACFTPTVTTVYILTCHYSCSHLSFLTWLCPASISPTSSHTEPASVCAQRFVHLTHTHTLAEKERHESEFLWETGWTPAAAPHFLCVPVSVSAVCTVAGLLDCLQG